MGAIVPTAVAILGSISAVVIVVGTIGSLRETFGRPREPQRRVEDGGTPIAVRRDRIIYSNGSARYATRADRVEARRIINAPSATDDERG